MNRTRAVAAAATLATISSLGSAAVATAATPAPKVYSYNFLSKANVTDATTTTATAKSLPTAQMNGVGWVTRVIASTNTAYIGGSFTKARPAGAPAGYNEVTRNNLMAINIHTGAMTNFTANTNGTVYAIQPSADGKTLYIGGDFTQVNGVTRNHIAAVDATTGTVLTNFNPSTNGHVYGITTIGNTVYIGGSFSVANGTARKNTAAFTTTGTLTGWNVATDAMVHSIIATPDNTSVVLGGTFSTVNGSNQPATAKVDATTGTVQAWALNKTMNLSGQAGAWSLRTDGSSIYASFEAFGKPGFEGVTRVDPKTGNIIWAEDCHGDSYDAAVMNGIVYVASHEHDCTDQGSWSTQPGEQHYRATAFTVAPHGVTQAYNGTAYSSFAGLPSSAQVAWYPQVDAGKVTGMNQGTWSVDAANGVVVMAGEFPRVNGTGQQGIARFAVPGVDGSTRTAPQPFTQGMNLLASAKTTGTKRALQHPTTWTQSGQVVTEQLHRSNINGTDNKVLVTRAVSTSFFTHPMMGYTDCTAVAGHHYHYWVTAQVAGNPTVVSSNVVTS